MELLGQGLVLMLAGMGIVYLFLITLIFTTKVSSSFVARFDSILPQDAPKNKKAPKAAVANDDENIALAIAVAMG